ncbi:hypothetical protein [Halarcobacter sp.]|uniref:hypothetical protein n=1 Tax=Halarcobacter sp. TaxID=2321133 RepID=UPI0029F50DDF|nr:hypothetical protein [Halarcobacter sp.]
MADATIVNNTKDMYEIIDTSIKIGLGAAIGGVFSFLTLKSNQKYEVKKEKRAFKIKTLDEASTILEEYFKSSYELMNFFYGCAYKEIYNFESFNQQRKDTYKEKDTLYSNSITKAQESLSKFNIIGLKEIENIIINHDELVINIRNDFIINNDLPQFEKIDSIITKMISLKINVMEK